MAYIMGAVQTPFEGREHTEPLWNLFIWTKDHDAKVEEGDVKEVETSTPPPTGAPVEGVPPVSLQSREGPVLQENLYDAYYLL